MCAHAKAKESKAPLKWRFGHAHCHLAAQESPGRRTPHKRNHRAGNHVAELSVRRGGDQ